MPTAVKRLIIFSIFCLWGGLVHADKFDIEEIDLAVTTVNVNPKRVYPYKVVNMVVGKDYIVFNTKRNLLIKTPRSEIAALSKLLKLPDGYDWHQSVCKAGDKLFITVGNYPEERHQKDIAAPTGGFRGGPKPVGAFVIQFRPMSVKLIKELSVISKPEIPEVHAGSKRSPLYAIPSKLVPSAQSCLWDGNLLYVGAYGYLGKLDIEKSTVAILDYDFDLEFNRGVIWKERNNLWYVMNEGGMGGAVLVKRYGNKTTSFSMLNTNDLVPDSILRHGGKLLTSTPAGVIEIIEASKRYRWYKLTSDKSKMAVFEIAVIQNSLWGLREDGWINFDLASKKATHYRFSDKKISNNVYAIAYYDNTWYIATDKELVEVDLKIKKQ